MKNGDWVQWPEHGRTRYGKFMGHNTNGTSRVWSGSKQVNVTTDKLSVSEAS